MKSHASMNRIYRLVWNAALNLWVAVAENVKGSGQSSRAGRAAAAVLATLALLTPQAYGADAANATVSSGIGNVATSGNTTTINQSTQRLAIDWTSLSTRANEALIFNQPNAQAIALNRITGSSPSTLLGSLTANGQVFILNPNGVLFGAGSQVNVGGLVASTLSMSNADFEAGNNVFTNTGTRGSVVNQGTLNASQGGYIALLAPEVRNEGVISASLGTALLAAGNKVTLNLDNGSLLGYSIDQGAIHALAENKHLIQADGGQVLLSAKALDSLTTATVNNTGIIEARTLQNQAGRILLMGDMDVGTVNVAGTLDASAATGGDGGFIETSAARVKVADGTKVTTIASQGITGTWLIDPTDFTISAGSAVQTSSGIGASTLSAALGGSNVAISTDAAGSGNGDIHVNSAVSWAANKLTLTAHRNININTNLNASGTAQLALAYGQASAAGAGSGYFLNNGAKVQLPAGNNFSTRQGSGGATLGYTVITDLGVAGSTSATDLQGINGGLAGRYVLGADIDAAATAGWNSGAGFAPLGISAVSLQFTGHFDGLGHSVNGLVINRPTTDEVGLFGSAGSGTLIRNVGLVGGSVTGRNNTGSLVGASSNGVNISNVFATGSVVGGTGVGGLVGNYSGNISNAYATGNVTGANLTGGLVGFSNGNIINAYATGNVHGGAGTAGGLVGLHGRNNGLLRNVYATGSVTGGSLIGGLVGENIFGGRILDAYSTDSANPLIGRNTSDGDITNTYTTGRGVFGIDEGVGNITYNYWNITTSGLASSINSGTGITTAQMMSAGTFTGWSIATEGGSSAVWRIYEGQSGPLLRNFLTAVTLADTSGTYNGATQSGTATAIAGILGSAATGRNAGAYASGYYSSQQGYDISGGKLSIARADLVLSTGDVSKTYDGTTAATGAAVAAAGTQLFGIDTAGGGSFAFTDKDAGNGNKSVTASGVTVSDGNSGNNYNISYVNNTTSTINKAALTVTATGVNKVYDGNTAATVTYADNRIAGDVLAISSTASFLDKNAGTGKAVNVSGMALSSTDAGNYTLTGTTTSTSAEISKASLAVTANNDSKLADGSVYSGGKGVSYSGLVAGETSAVLGGGLLYGGSSQGASTPGSYAITASGLRAGNYALSYVSGVLIVQPGSAVASALGGPALGEAYANALRSVAGTGKAGSDASKSAADAAELVAAAAEASNSDEE